MESIRSGLADLQGSIQCIENFIVPIAREGDTYIMDAICESKKFTKNEVRQINACRLYLKVLLTSDISTPCGTYIAHKYYRGSIEDKQNWPTIKYPRQARPNSGAWILWRKALHSLFLEDDKTTLLASLGAWFPRHRSHYQWKYFLHENTLYKTTATKEYSKLECTKTTRRTTRYALQGERVTTIPLTSQPVEVDTTKDGYVIQGIETFLAHPPVSEATPATLQDWIRLQPQSHQELLQEVELAADETEIAELLAKPAPILLASDGGAVPGRGSFGWVLQIGSQIIARGKGPAYGPDPRSFRAEGYGMASGLLFLRVIQQYAKIKWSND
jgi:hypothetical protein